MAVYKKSNRTRRSKKQSKSRRSKTKRAMRGGACVKAYERCVGGRCYSGPGSTNVGPC